MSDAVHWLETRHPDAPAALAERMRTALEGVAEPGVPVWRVLAEAAMDRLGAALPAAAGRGGALDLLTADALLTHACEAAAEEGPEALQALTRGYGARRLMMLLGEGS